ncbi:hypothetical protein HRM2_23380 [Desulforapulum autotrophicum HRM2]|uniref:Uncharacterized protein n=2 Tax=Desulforapulum autotrophicum TaxID=2296 RepID=C0QEU1_DESAH|nr:hypothetical protein HRM2_23380 [Desulforapulum autotrophicum HRM2]
MVAILLCTKYMTWYLVKHLGEWGIMRIKLNLDNHCVETEIRKLYNAKVKSCLRGQTITDHDADVIELLKALLETVDFPGLRSALKAVSGEKTYPAVLVVDRTNKPWIEIKNQRIEMGDKQG